MNDPETAHTLDAILREREARHLRQLQVRANEGLRQHIEREQMAMAIDRQYGVKRNPAIDQELIKRFGPKLMLFVVERN